MLPIFKSPGLSNFEHKYFLEDSFCTFILRSIWIVCVECTWTRPVGQYEFCACVSAKMRHTTPLTCVFSYTHKHTCILTTFCVVKA